MDFFDLSDLIPIVPPSGPGERSSALTPEQRFVAGIGATLLPTLSFLVVLFTGFAAKAVIALAVLPLASATVVFVVSRRLVATPLAWAIVIAMGSAAFCFVADTGALALHLFAQFFHDF
jgi:hypothetical protein